MSEHNHNPCPFGSQEQCEQVVNDLRDIKFAVIGNKKLGATGLVDRVDKLEKWQTKLNLRIAAMSSLGVGIAFTVKYLLTGH